MAFEILYTDANGAEKRINKFLPYAEFMMHEELMKSIEYQLTLGKRQTHVDAATGYWKKTGAGLREQLKDGWTEYYNGPVTTALLREYLMDIYFARTDESDRDTVMMTGTVGADMFHNALAANASSYFTMDTHYVRQNGTVNGTPQLSFGAQFTKYTGPHGISISLTKNPLYDSREFCKKEHPLYPGKPIDSARFTILDFGSYKGESNISMVSVKDTFHHGYVAGTHTPTGPIKGGMGGAMKNGYDMWTQGSAGLWIKDVTRCGELIYDAE